MKPDSVILPDKTFFSIGETSQITRVKPHTLRYWESEFKLLRPIKSKSGHRRYTKKDIDIIFQIIDLLYEKKLTIAGAKKYLLSEKRGKKDQLQFEFTESTAAIELLKETKKTLQEIIKILK